MSGSMDQEPSIFMPIPIMKYHIQGKLLERPVTPLSLLAYVIRQLYKKRIQENYYTSNQYASLIFGNGIDDQDKISKIRREFSDYIQYNQRQFRFRLEKLYEHYPEIWGENRENQPVEDEICKALNHEIATQIKDKKFLYLLSVSKIERSGQKIIYKGVYEDDDENQILLPEGVNVEYRINNTKTNVTILEQNIKDCTIIFDCTNEIEVKGKARLNASPEMLLVGLREKIEGYDVNLISFNKLFTGNPEVEPVNTEIKYTELLSNSQLIALKKSLSRSINYIWGPPGTGKTHTLARLLLNLYLNNERTIVCSIANVAVDGIALKFIELADIYEKTNGINILRNGDVLRLGFVRTKELREREEIFPNTPIINTLRDELAQLAKRISRINKTKALYAKLLSEIHQKEEELAQHIKQLIKNAKIIFCTSSKAVLDPIIYDSYFDNLVIDEGSMMSPAYLFALARKQSKRLVIAGDFRQLGPIATGRSDMIDKWLKRSLFDLLADRDEIPDHELVSMLTEQRRSEKGIVQLINEPFYNNRLKSVYSKRHDDYLHMPPNSGRSIAFVDLGDKQDYLVERSASQSRFNLGSFNYVINLVKSIYNNNSTASIGIIAPYKSQVNLYKKELENLLLANDDLFKPNINAGTIHSFQGSEYDIIIYDMVDSLKTKHAEAVPIGRLYFGEVGEQLINVAVSRAISKLIVVGCKNVLNEGGKRDQVSSKTKYLIKTAYKVGLQIGK